MILINGPFSDPLPQQFDFSHRQLIVTRIGRRHALGFVFGDDALVDFTRLGIAGNFTDATAYAVTIMGNMGAVKPYLKFGNRSVSGGTLGGITVAQMANIGTTYDLSKRTKLYLDYVIDTSPAQAPGATNNPTQFGFGMQHTF